MVPRNDIVSASMIADRSAEDDALMMLKEKYPEIWDFIIHRSAKTPKPLDIQALLKSGRDPRVMLDDLMERSATAHGIDFADATGVWPPHTLSRY